MTDEKRKEYLLKKALIYLKRIENSEYSDALCLPIYYDKAESDGHCLMDDIEIVL